MNKRSLLPFILVSLLALSSCKKREEPRLTIPTPPITSQDSGDSSQDTVVNTVDHVENLDPISSVDPEETHASEILVRIAELNEKLDEAGLEETRLSIAKIGLEYDLEFERFLQPFNEELNLIKVEVGKLDSSNVIAGYLQTIVERMNLINVISSEFSTHIIRYYEYKTILKSIGIEIRMNDSNEFEIKRPFIFISTPYLRYEFFNQYYIPTRNIVSESHRLEALKNVIDSNGHTNLINLNQLPTASERSHLNTLNFLFPPDQTYYFYRRLNVRDGDYTIDVLGEAQDRVRTLLSTFRSSLSDERKEKEQKLLHFITQLTLNAMNIKSITIVDRQKSLATFSMLKNQEVENKIFMLVNKDGNFNEIVGVIEHNRSKFSQFQQEDLIRRLSAEEVEDLNVKNIIVTVYQNKNIFYIQKR